MERLGRTVKDEAISLWRSEGVPHRRPGLGRYFPSSNEERLPPALAYRTPAVVHPEGW